jgi:hypothetical protein
VEIENPEHQERLRRWMPLLWIVPLALILLLAALAYLGR